MKGWRLQVPSSGRAQHVPRLEQLLDLQCDWFVPAEQEADYRYAGARSVIPISYEGWAGRLAAQRNAMLEAAFAEDRASVQCDDDLKSIKWLAEVRGKPERISGRDAVHRVLEAMDMVGAKLGGCAPTTNALNYRRAITTAGWIRSWIVVAPSPERFDTACVTKADWDFVLQHLHAYGTVARCDGLLMDFPYRKGRGGCEDYRTQDVLDDGAEYIAKKWPDAVAPATKPGELRLTWKP